MSNTLYIAACKKLKYKTTTLKQFDFLPENQRVSFFAEHRMITIIEHANLDSKGKKFKIDWLNWNQKKWRNWYEANKDTEKSSGLGFSFSDTNCGNSYTYVSSRLHFRTEKIANKLGNSPEFLQAVNEYIQ